MEIFVLLIGVILLFAYFIFVLHKRTVFLQKTVHQMYYITLAMARIQAIHPVIIGNKAKEVQENIKFLEEILKVK